jgi:hypothetical protein
MSLLPVGISGEEAGYQISRSLRFNSADTAYLNRTPSSTTDRRKFTYSTWVKRAALGTFQTFIAATDSSTQDGFLFRDNNTIQINFNNITSSQLVTTQVFRDVSAWYHLVMSVDTTQATASNRIKLYVNGVQVTAFSTANYPSQNYDTFFNTNTYLSRIGYSGLNSNPADMYMTEINFIDGQALTPTSFGEFNSDTGVWQPKKYTGTYGTNGFYLNFSDNASTTTLGDDFSGNNNDWTPNNFSVTAGAGNDSLVDSPTRYGTDTGAGGTVRGNYATWNPLRNAATLANGNLDISGPTNGVNSFATIGVSSGKWYWEVTVTSVQNTYYPGIGVNTNLALSPTDQSGADAVGYMYLADGQKFNSNTGSAYGASFTTNDVIGVALDMDAGTITFYKNGSSQGQAFSGITGTAVPVVISWTSSTCVGNFGQRPFAYTAPSGFKALVTTNLPTPTIEDGGDYFNTVVYAGNSPSSQTIAVGFQPDFVWQKSIGQTYNHTLYDAVRGATKELYSNTTGVEVVDSNGLTAFTSNGFTVGSDGELNDPTANHVAWNWKANGSGVTNTAGTITSTVSVNTTSGISIATYTGNGSAGQSIGHGLGVTPKLVIKKNRSQTTNWAVTTTIIDGSNDYLFLNATNAAGDSGETAPTSSVIYVFPNTENNSSGDSFVCYSFAPVEGFSAFGKYTGNGLTDGPFVFVNHRPAFLLIKRTDTTSNWTILDFAREGYNVDNDPLYPNLSNAEGTTDLADLLSNGFKLRSTDASVNASGGTYIYAAFCSNPFVYSLAR